MPRIYIDKKLVISYDSSAKDKYWTALSQFLIGKHGKNHFTDHQKVEEILLDGFNFLVDKFKNLIYKENEFKFYLYIFYLHEESIKIHLKILGGLKLKQINEYEFAMYRRILKLILEQGCDVDMNWGGTLTGNEVLEMDEKIQELLYIGTWLYGFADFIAFQKMVEKCYQIEFNEQNLLEIDWQYHYGDVYHQLFPLLKEDYEKGTFDEEAIHELRETIENCFNISYDFAGGIIFEIKRKLNPNDPEVQTIQPYVLPKNLSTQFNIPIEEAELFYNGLSISRENKLSIEEVILKPHSTKRHLYRPILIYNIGGKDRALVGEEKYSESMTVLATNAIHWNAIYSEWLKNKCIQKFINKKSNEHDKILENQIEKVLIEKGFLFCRNIKSFKQPSKSNIRIDNELAGEIDFIIINIDLKLVFVSEVKYNRARYDTISYRTDNSNFINSYEPKLNKKVNWIKNNLVILQEHLKIIYNKQDISILDFNVHGVFLINTPTFYMFNGLFKAITLKQVGDYFEGKYDYPQLFITREEGNLESFMMVRHPYFRVPMIFNDDESE